MLKINFVTEQGRWILGRWCDEFVKHIEGATITALVPDDNADVNVFVNYALFCEGNYKTISVFTHREHDLGLMHLFNQVARESDWCLGQSNYTMSLLPKEKSSYLPIGVGAHFFKDSLRLGMPVKRQNFNRKRLDWIEEIERINGVEVVFADGKVAYEDMPDFYDSIDYVLITSEIEGGPMAIKEGLARGKMIISTNVGWASELPIIRYDTLAELKAILNKLVIPRNEWELGAKVIVDTASMIYRNNDV